MSRTIQVRVEYSAIVDVEVDDDFDSRAVEEPGDWEGVLHERVGPDELRSRLVLKDCDCERDPKYPDEWAWTKQDALVGTGLAVGGGLLMVLALLAVRSGLVGVRFLGPTPWLLGAILILAGIYSIYLGLKPSDESAFDTDRNGLPSV